jgi:cytochrome c553
MNLRTRLFLATLLTSPACHAEPPAAIEVCGTCHGANGVATQPRTPHLNNQSPAFLGDTMKAYANGSRPTAVPEHKTFPADEIEAMATFYRSQKGAIRPVQETNPAVVAKGQTIYTDRCANCHVDSGRDSDKDAPLVAAQNKEFLAAQSRLFKTGARKFPFMMDDSYRDLTDDDLAAVAEYFAAQEQFAPVGDKKKRRKQ